MPTIKIFYEVFLNFWTIKKYISRSCLVFWKIKNLVVEPKGKMMAKKRKKAKKKVAKKKVAKKKVAKKKTKKKTKKKAKKKKR